MKKVCSAMTLGAAVALVLAVTEEDAQEWGNRS